MAQPLERRSQNLSSVTTAAAVLKEFGKGDTQLGVSQLARRVGVTKSTAHRVVRTLASEGLLEKVDETGLFRLTTTMRNLGISAETAQSLHRASTLALEDLRSATEHTLHLAILDGTDVLYGERRESPSALQLFGRVGGRNSVHVTSTGKVLVAHLEPEEQRRIVESIRLTRRTAHTITSRRALVAELAKVRRLGYGENRFESVVGMISIAAPVRDRTGRVVASVSIAGQAERATDNTISALLPSLLETAGRISRNLGWLRSGHLT